MPIEADVIARRRYSSLPSPQTCIGSQYNTAPNRLCSVSLSWSDRKALRHASPMADTKMIKTVGEHWVCATLARHGWAPALTRDGIERTDLLAVGTRLPDRPTVEIQVKAATQINDKTSWPLGGITRHVAASEHEWIVLVLVPAFPSEPRAFVVPRDHASAATWVVHEDWRTDLSAPEGQRNARMSQARIRWTIFAGYENGWDLLGTPTSKVGVRLPSWIRQLAQDQRVGLPTDHPWNKNLPGW